MIVQNYLLCILYLLLIIVHSFTICEKGFHRGLISIFTSALFIETLSTIFFTTHQIILTYGQQLTDLIEVDFGPMYSVHYFAQLIHIIAINFFILFLLIVAKGWPITRRDMPFKYAFAVFWLLCLAADLITFYWTTLTIIAKNLTSDYLNTAQPIGSTTTNMIALNVSTIVAAPNSTTLLNLSSIIESLPKDAEQFNSTPRRLSLVLRIVIMVYFLLELRTTMILEQEKKKLQFYLHFGALTMVWFVHSVIVYVISLRVEIIWQSKLISGCSSAANYLAFAIVTRLLWPKSSRSYLFKKRRTRVASGRAIDDGYDEESEDEQEHVQSINDGPGKEEYDGLEMHVLTRDIGASGDIDQHNEISVKY